MQVKKLKERVLGHFTGKKTLQWKQAGHFTGNENSLEITFKRISSLHQSCVFMGDYQCWYIYKGLETWLLAMCDAVSVYP